MKKKIHQLTYEERRALFNEYNRRYRERKKASDPDYNKKLAARKRARYHRLKDDPTFIQQQREYGRRRYHEKIKTDKQKQEQHRVRTQTNQALRRLRLLEKKKELQRYCGGKCVRCGNEDLRVLDFDHIDPLTKRMMISQSLHLPMDELKQEVDKCQLLCANCHRIKTLEDKQFNPNMREYRNKSRSVFKRIKD